MKISIITATNNSAATVSDTLESVLRQNYKNYELIIKDGGSKDDTLEICRSYESAFDGRMKIISCPDKGLYDAMNQGIKAATGDVVGILNSDDFYTSFDVLMAIARQFERTPEIDAPIATSVATFSFGDHSAYISSYFAIFSLTSVLGVPG